jgi:lipopolysaccharide/colanic/teichoic acid biosynthesis glycosyltransferase
MMKRAFDLLTSCIGGLLLAPVFVVTALAVKIGDGGPVFYRQQRIGREGRPFGIWKFRTMSVGADRTGPSITKTGDTRVTRLGRFLRKSKLDEIPQLWNVLRGEMSLVGPRPEMPKYVALYTDEQKAVLKLRPGITDLASLEFRNEEELLAAAPDAETFYREFCIPRKIELNLQYAARASLVSDLAMIFATISTILKPQRPIGRINIRPPIRHIAKR